MIRIAGQHAEDVRLVKGLWEQIRAMETRQAMPQLGLAERFVDVSLGACAEPVSSMIDRMTTQWGRIPAPIFVFMIRASDRGVSVKVASFMSTLGTLEDCLTSGLNAPPNTSSRVGSSGLA